jgi:hypothetical protein
MRVESCIWVEPRIPKYLAELTARRKAWSALV